MAMMVSVPDSEEINEQQYMHTDKDEKRIHSKFEVKDHANIFLDSFDREKDDG